MSTEPYYLICDKCRKPTPSGLAADEQSVETLRATGNETRCGHCGHMNPWGKAELWPESVVREKGLL